MKIISIEHVEDCFDGSYIYEVVFDCSISEHFIVSLKKHGKLNYYKSFARPFFKVMFTETSYLKGVEGNTTARLVVFDKKDLDYAKQLVEN